MPNIKRRFADDDPSDGDDDSDEEEEYRMPMRGGGKALRMPGGKGMGKQLRYAPPANDDDDDDSDDDDDDDDDSDAEDDSDDDEDEAPAPIRPVQRGGGKALVRPSSGKQLRPPPQDDDSDDDDLEDDDDDDDDDDSDAVDDSDDDEPPAPIRPVQRGGGKALSRMRPPSDDEDDDDDDEEEEPAPQVPVHRGGGKQLRPPPSSGKQLRRPVEDSDDDDDDDDDDDEPATQVPVHRGGGKQLRPPPSRGGGKQLRRPVEDSDDDNDDEEDEKPVQPQRIVHRGGKQLSSGKQLRRVQESDDDDDDDMMDVAAPDDDEEEEEEEAAEEEKKASAVEEKKKTDDKDDDGVDDMELDSDDDDDDDEPEPEKEKPAPRGRAAAKKAAPEPDDMEESDDDSSSEEEFDMDMENLDQNQLIKDEDDRKHLESLSEFDREAILAQRFEQRKKEHDMRVALRETKRKEREAKKGQKATKRKAPASAKKASKKAKEDDTSKDEELAQSLTSRRSSTRDRDANKKKESTKKALAALREERKKVVVKESESESDFDDDDDDDSDDDYEESGTLKPWQKKAQEEKKKQRSRLDEYEVEDDEGDLKEETQKQTPKVFKPAELEDYLLVTLSRARLGKWCNEPYFERAVKKCFVKLFVGENEEGKRCYRLCRIVSVENSKQPYALPKARNAPRKEKPVTTDKMLNLEFAGTRKVFPLRLVSDNKVNQSDVTQYETAMKTARKADDILGKVEAMKLRRKRDELVNNFTYSTEDIERKVKEIKKKKGVNTTNLGLEQTRAANAVEVAQGALEDAKARLLEARDGAETDDAQKEVKIAEENLRERLEEEQVILKKVKSRQERNKNRSNNWVDVNERAKKLNRLADVGLNKPKSKASDKSPSGKVAFNPYARRKVKPKNLWQVGQGDEKKEEENKEEEALATTNDGQTNGEKNLDSTPPLVQEQQGKAAALSQSHQFSIDEETLAQTSFLSGIGGLASKKKARKRVRKGLSLTEYQERKAAGTL